MIPVSSNFRDRYNFRPYSKVPGWLNCTQLNSTQFSTQRPFTQGALSTPFFLVLSTAKIVQPSITSPKRTIACGYYCYKITCSPRALLNVAILSLIGYYLLHRVDYAYLLCRYHTQRQQQRARQYS